MGSITDFIASFNWIDRVEGVISTFINADWKTARQSGGPGMAAEFGLSVTGRNRWKLEVPRDCGWSGAEIERFLRRYGVRIWGRGFTPENLTFFVKVRQANWAEYLLLRRGIPVASRLFNPRNVAYGELHAPGSAPSQSRNGGRRLRTGDLVDRLLSWIG